MSKYCIGIALTMMALGVGRVAVAQDAAPTPSKAHVDFYRFNSGHTGYTAEKLTTPLSLLWRHTTTAAKDNPASPLYAAGVVFFGSGPAFYAVNADDGTTKWRYPASGSAETSFATTPALAGGFLYVTGENSKLYKLDSKTGSLVWSKAFNGVARSAPVAYNGLIYFGGSDNQVHAVKADTGDSQWDYTTGGAITTSPTIADNRVIIASADSNIYSLDARNGTKAWSIMFPGDPSAASPVFDGDTLYAGAGDTLYAISTRRGDILWKAPLGGELVEPPTVSPNGIYAVTQDNSVYSLNNRGRINWRSKLDYPPTGAPLLAGATLLVPTHHGVLQAFGAGTGKSQWEYVVQAADATKRPQSAITEVADSPVFVDNTLYVVSDDGSLNAFRADSPDTIPPQVVGVSPGPGSFVPQYRYRLSATVVDEGSGIDASTCVFQVDGAPVPFSKYDATRNAVIVDSAADPAGKLGPDLKPGPHQASLRLADWRGNVLNYSWAFTVAPGRGGRRGGGGGGGEMPFSPGGGEPGMPPPPPL